MTRILPREEWPRLVGTELETVWPLLDPATTRIVVVERTGAIVGCHALFIALHAEGLWLAPAERGRSSVAGRLWKAVQANVRAMGSRGFLTAAVDDTVRGLLAHVGATQLPGDHYAVPVKESACQQQ